MMWNGRSDEIPCGWTIVDNLIGKFPAGAGEGGYAVGATAGKISIR
ncbi:MAG: hypothetical protein LBH58_05700 [Tannerellaceae bacterium]|nr:hypothetical protein [Tannerellaceae bacterium]